jgi:hypothetical protein
MKEHVPTVSRQDVLLYRIDSLLEFWGGRPITTIKRSTCADYIKWRVRRERRVETKAGEVKVIKGRACDCAQGPGNAAGGA